MRPIKFRAWDRNRKIMISPSMESPRFLRFDGGDVLTVGEYMNAFGGGASLTYESGLVLMQFTGLLDSEGTEIYEGDIIKRHFPNWPSGAKIRVVEWGIYDDDEYVSTLECWMAGTWPVSDLGGRHSVGEHTIEVIGNSHENPELLK